MKLYHFIFILFSLNAFAFKFSPMSVTLTPSEGQNSNMVFLENDSSTPIAIQLTATKRIMDKFGKEDNPEELEEIDLYPNQLIIPAFEKKSVKVTFRGKEIKDIEKAYRIIAEQLPLDLEKEKKKKGNVKILLRYIGALYVDPGKTASQIKLKDFALKENNFHLSFENLGTRHQVLGNLKLVFKKNKNKDIELSSKDLKNFSGENILAKSEREFIIPKHDKLLKLDSSYEVKFTFDQD